MGKRPPGSCYVATCPNCGTQDWIILGDQLCSHCVRIAAVRAERGLEEIGRYLAAHAAFEVWLRDHEVAA